MKKHIIIKLIVIMVSLLIISNDLMIFPQIGNIERLFKLGRYYYLNREYNNAIDAMRRVVKEINQYDKDENVKDIEPRMRKMLGWAHLLMGASYEQQGEIPQARNQYKLAQALLNKLEIDGLDLSSLPEYRKFITEEMREQTVLEKTFQKSQKKKRINPYLKIGIAAIAITAFVLLVNLKGKQPDSPAELEVTVENLSINHREGGTHWTIIFIFKNVGEVPITIDRITIPPPNSNIKENVLYELHGGHPPLGVVAGAIKSHAEHFTVEDYEGIEKITINIYYSDAKNRPYFKQIEIELKE